MRCVDGGWGVSKSAADDVLPVAFVKVGLAEVLVHGTASEQVISGDQNAVADGDNGALFAAPCAQSSKQGWQIGVFGLAAGPGRFIQCCPHPTAPFALPPSPPLPPPPPTPPALPPP